MCISELFLNAKTGNIVPSTIMRPKIRFDIVSLFNVLDIEVHQWGKLYNT